VFPNAHAKLRGRSPVESVIPERDGTRFPVTRLGRNELIRIAFVIPTLDQSGAERQMTLLAKGLPKEEFEVRVIALNRGGHFGDQLQSSGIPVEVLGKRLRFDPLAYVRLRKSLAGFQPHVVQSFLFAANSYVRLPGIVPRECQIVVSERCVDSWKSGWQLQLDRRLVSRTNAMTVNSASVAEFYASAGVPRSLIHTIPNAMPVGSSEYSRDEAREILGLQPHHKVVGFVGRLAEQKRLPDVVWAFQLLHQVVDDVRLVLIGDGPERDALAELASSFGCRHWVVFAGHREDATSLMSAFDVFVLASSFEGMSNSLMEAMSLGIPCIASDIPPNQELIRHEETGLLFPTGSSPDLTKALARILNDSEFARRIGDTGRDLIQRDHAVPAMVEAYRQLYRRLIDGI
jgi:glycosyltransferase involved in cell wall biosynthesis